MSVSSMKRLLDFQSEVMMNTLVHDLAQVTNDEGVVGVVSCLDDEPLEALMSRIEACGGFATVFSLAEDGRVRMVEVVDEVCALGQGAEPMLDKDAPAPNATIGLFLDYLETRPHGVVIPQRLGSPIEAISSPRAVEFESA